METKKIVMGVISVAVAIIVLMSMIPIFTDAGASEDTITNSGYLRMKHITAEDEGTYVISFDSTNHDQIVVNDVAIPFTNIPDTALVFNCLFNSNWLMRANVNSGAGYVSTLQYYTTSGGVTSYSSVTITAAEGTATIEGGSSTKTASYTDLYIPDLNGPYIMKDRDKPAYMLADSEFIGYGLTAMVNPANPTGSKVSPGLGLLVTGTIEDGATITPWRGISSYNSSYSDETVNYTESTRWKEVYDLTSITFTATLTSTSDDTVTADTPVTYSYFLVPYEITAERIIHTSPVEATLIGLIPLLMMVGIMLTAVGLFIAKYRKN